MLELPSQTGQNKLIVIESFPALVGWDMQRRFVEFAASTDTNVRLQYTMDVLAYAKVILGDVELPLSTSSLIDNHLEKWENIQVVFEEVLRHNGIDPDTHANQPRFWAEAGAEMAVAFSAECIKLFGPAIEAAAMQKVTE